ncbi:Gigasin-6 [Hypsizygus marmoreus]|uniref:Gigasin-6 n=1 Tax=Hypsizygus marmoreus TaxID=39966 RepID=A0A369KDS7_HYPMA|nr:Gigasin-6 [Hypsizygus marmoreus]
MHLLHLVNLVSLYLLYGSVVSLQQVYAQGAPAKILTQETDAFINQVLADWKSPGGVAVAVVRRNEQGVWNVETKGYGNATANGTKVTENTLFAIGSNSKLFDALATGLLISNETLSPRLSWTTKIASIIPNWQLMDSTATKEATIIDLMSHRTGLPRHDLSYKWSDDVPTVIKKLKFQRPSAEFRDAWQYNNNMYLVMSYFPTVLLPSKLPYARYVKKYIFDLLGLKSTTFSYDVANASGQLADGIARKGIDYFKDPLGGTPQALPYWSTKGGEDGNILSGAGGIISNAVDMATFLQALLLEGVKPGTNVSVIPADVIQRVSSGISVVSPIASTPELSPTVYGGGQVRGTYHGHEVVEHDGGTPGFLSSLSRLPFDNLGIAVLTNDNDYGGFISQVIKYRLMDEALGLEKVDWNGRYLEGALFPPTPATPRPSNASLPSANFSSLAGIYDNGGYGKFELCLVSLPHPAASESCKALKSNIPTILPGAVDPKIPTFIAAWDSPWASHVRFTHFSGNIFNVTTLTSFATKNASEPFWTYGGDTSFNIDAHAETVIEGSHIGIAVTGTWGAGPSVPAPQGKTARDRAEVIFEKI